MSNTVILFGMPGVGKSTVLYNLKCAGIQFRQFSVRLFTMQLLESNTPIGRYLRENQIVKPRVLMPAPVVEQIFSAFLTTTESEDFVVIEGFPINREQYLGMTRQLEKAKRRLDGMIVLTDSPERIHSRVVGRKVCPSCELKNGAGLPFPLDATHCPYCGGSLVRRADDEEDFFMERCRLFQQQLKALSELLPPEQITTINVGEQNAVEAFRDWRQRHGGA